MHLSKSSMKTLNLQHKLDEALWLEPTNLGSSFLTNIYKLLTGQLKTKPLLVIVPISFVGAVFTYIVLGLSVVKVVSLLQNGF